MKIGLHVPQWGPDATRSGVLSVARAVEDAGLDSVWVADHVVYPLRSQSRYPYREEGTPFAPEEGFLDAITTLGALAGATKRVLLGTSVLVLPMREPLQVAKALATLDVLSDGRVIAGVGAGWWGGGVPRARDAVRGPRPAARRADRHPASALAPREAAAPR